MLLSPIAVVAFGAAAVVMVGVALLACYLPSRRATRIDAVIALRQQQVELGRRPRRRSAAGQPSTKAVPWP